MTPSRRCFTGLLLAAAGSFLFHGALHAQPAINATGAQQVVSPEVAPDRKVTLRLFAPNAKAVTLNGDFFTSGPTSAAMTKDDKGVWSITLPPQDQGIHGYYFRVDG